MAKLGFEVTVKSKITIWYYLLYAILWLKIESFGWWFIKKFSNKVIVKYITNINYIKYLTIGDFIKYTKNGNI